MSLSKIEQLDLLVREGFDIPVTNITRGRELSESVLSAYVIQQRKESHYEIDGIVIDVNNFNKRSSMHPTTETLNPAYAIKYKTADASNRVVAEVVGVTWNISKHGYLKPQVNVKPIHLVGVTVQNATGFNAKFIMESRIGTGAKIIITRSGDVIPYIIGVDTPAASPSMPDCDYVWNETGVDIYVENCGSMQEVIVAQAVDFFSSIGVTNLKDGVVTQLYEEYQYANIADCLVAFLTYRANDWTKVVGKNGGKIHQSIQQALSGELTLDEFAGALPFFGRGVGQRKFKKLLKDLKIKNVEDINGLTVDQIVSVHGFDYKTAVKIMSGKEKLAKLIDDLRNNFVEICFKDDIIASSNGKLVGQKVVMTGFRDDELTKRIEIEGGEVQNSFSSTTTMVIAKDPNSTSGKLTKAREKGIVVQSKDQFIKMLSLM